MIERGALFFPNGVDCNNSKSRGNFFVVLGVVDGKALLAGTNEPPPLLDDMDTIGCCPQCKLQCYIIDGEADNYGYRYSVLFDRQNMDVWDCAELATKGSVKYVLSRLQMEKLKKCAHLYKSLPTALLSRFFVEDVS